MPSNPRQRHCGSKETELSSSKQQRKNTIINCTPDGWRALCTTPRHWEAEPLHSHSSSSSQTQSYYTHESIHLCTIYRDTHTHTTSVPPVWLSETTSTNYNKAEEGGGGGKGACLCFALSGQWRHVVWISGVWLAEHLIEAQRVGEKWGGKGKEREQVVVWWER